MSTSGGAGSAWYGAWHGGPDPLEPPFDIREALDAIGEDVLAGESPEDALRRLMRHGMDGLSGLDALRRQVRERQRQTRRQGQLDGTLRQVKKLLEQALTAEREQLSTDPSDDARLAESELADLPTDPARAVRELRDYQWHSDEARAAYEKIEEMLRSEVLDAQFHGMKQALQQASPEDMAGIKDMLADLNQMLAADARGEHTQQQFDDFMAKHGQYFPDNPSNLAELIDSLARRAAAQQRLMQSLSDAQRDELFNLMAGALGDAGMGAAMSELRQRLQDARPDLNWSGSSRMRGDQSMGYSAATGALADLADLDELEAALAQDYAGASLEDVDPELLERTLGRDAADRLAALRRIERELAEQGYFDRDPDGSLRLSPRAVRRLGATALRKVFERIDAPRKGGHDVTDAGAGGETTGASRPWEFGDEQPLDVVRTVSNAVRRSEHGGRGVRLMVDDFEVVETERRTTAAVALLVDLSYSMALRGTWAIAKQTALALHSLVTTRYPQDAIEIIGFSNYARVITPTELAGLSWDMVQGTNLQHGLMLAERHLSKHHGAEPVILIVTDGEPTAHLDEDGIPQFAWPPLPDTLRLTLSEVDRATRGGATINVFMLDPDASLRGFVDLIARRNGGRVFSPNADSLGEYVVRDYLRARRGRRASS